MRDDVPLCAVAVTEHRNINFATAELEAHVIDIILVKV